MNIIINILWVVTLIIVLSLLTFAYHFENKVGITPHAVRHVLENK